MIAYSTQMHTIYDGELKRYPDGHVGFSDKKRKDVTDECLKAAALALLDTGSELTFSVDGKEYVMAVTEVVQ